MSVIQLRPPTSPFLQDNRIYRDGILLEKGVEVSEDFLIQHEKFFADLVQLYTVYPDIYLDVIRQENSEFSLFTYQRVFLRSIMRYNQVYITATRAASKSFLSVLGMFLQCVFIPGHKCSLVAPVKTQGVRFCASSL